MVAQIEHGLLVPFSMDFTGLLNIRSTKAKAKRALGTISF